MGPYRLRLRPIRPPQGLELDGQAVAEIEARLRAEEAAQVDAITRRWEERQRRREYARLGLEPGDEVAPCNATASASLLAWVSQSLTADPPSARNALLWGDPGTGKTACAKAALLRYPGRGVFVGEAGMSSALKSCFRGTGDMDAFMRRWEDAPLLVLDDMGKAAGAEYRDWLAQAIYSLADVRWSRGLPTVVTANRCATDLVAAIAQPDMREAVHSRLFASAKIMHFTGPDRRADAG